MAPVPMGAPAPMTHHVPVAAPLASAPLPGSHIAPAPAPIAATTLLAPVTTVPQGHVQMPPPVQAAAPPMSVPAHAPMPAPTHTLPGPMPAPAQAPP
eukprot:CAMPEP_0116571998 /NCGR_PEP_ID=MMETSP0397-20121206/17915_1 /TAXON_ID=216820 /ORGANISM="Cyclophora tenuis, Strain ECT3854" /LENGTH=96 /DNA_ID=CAMNT_0004100245 /DNA_START=45 /DNA_END=331 /DNA_ORIENTATION=+